MIPESLPSDRWAYRPQTPCCVHTRWLCGEKARLRFGALNVAGWKILSCRDMPSSALPLRQMRVGPGGAAASRSRVVRSATEGLRWQSSEQNRNGMPVRWQMGRRRRLPLHHFAGTRAGSGQGWGLAPLVTWRSTGEWALAGFAVVGFWGPHVGRRLPLEDGEENTSGERLTCGCLGSLRTGAVDGCDTSLQDIPARFAVDTVRLFPVATRQSRSVRITLQMLPNIATCSTSEAGTEALPWPRKQSIVSTSKNWLPEAWLSLHVT